MLGQVTERMRKCGGTGQANEVAELIGQCLKTRHCCADPLNRWRSSFNEARTRIGSCWKVEPGSDYVLATDRGAPHYYFFVSFFLVCLYSCPLFPRLRKTMFCMSEPNELTCDKLWYFSLDGVPKTKPKKFQLRSPATLSKLYWITQAIVIRTERVIARQSFHKCWGFPSVKQYTRAIFMNRKPTLRETLREYCNY